MRIFKNLSVDKQVHSIQTIASFYWIDGKKLIRYYRDKLSSFRSWIYRKTAHRGLVFEQNLGPRLSIDETALSRGELYTIVTNKDAKGKKGTFVAIEKGTKSEEVISMIQIMSRRKRNKVEEITLDLAGSMGLIAKKCFPNAVQVID